MAARSQQPLLIALGVYYAFAANKQPLPYSAIMGNVLHKAGIIPNDRTSLEEWQQAARIARSRVAARIGAEDEPPWD